MKTTDASKTETNNYDGGQIMRNLFVILISVLLLPGCTISPAMKDIIDNKYEDKKIYADKSARYVGEWVGEEETSSKPIKITEDGRILMCLIKKKYPNVNGKVYMENGETMFIFEGGSIYKLDSVNNDLMILDYYGDKINYHTGIIPDQCLDAFKKFE